MGHNNKKHTSSKERSSKGHSSKHEDRKGSSSKKEIEYRTPFYHLTQVGTKKVPTLLINARCAAIWVESFWTGNDPGSTANHTQFKMIFQSPWGLYKAACVSMYVGVPYDEDPGDVMEQGSLSLVPTESVNPSAGSTQTLEISQVVGEGGQRSTPTLAELINPIFQKEMQYFSFDTRHRGVRDAKHWM